MNKGDLISFEKLKNNDFLLNIWELDLNSNKISSIITSGDFPNLKIVNLSLNLIQKISDIKGLHLPEVKKINLKFNPILELSNIEDLSLPSLGLIDLPGRERKIESEEKYKRFLLDFENGTGNRGEILLQSLKDTIIWQFEEIFITKVNIPNLNLLLELRKMKIKRLSIYNGPISDINWY